MPAFGDELKGWLASLRVSFATVGVVAIMLACAVTVAPKVAVYINQQRELTDLRENVHTAREQVSDAEAEHAKWLDPEFVRAQARGRLFYVMPGETQLSVIDDISVPADPPGQHDDTLTTIEHNWASTLALSFLVAATADGSPAEPRAGRHDSFKQRDSVGVLSHRQP